MISPQKEVQGVEQLRYPYLTLDIEERSKYISAALTKTIKFNDEDGLQLELYRIMTQERKIYGRHLDKDPVNINNLIRISKSLVLHASPEEHIKLTCVQDYIEAVAKWI